MKSITEECCYFLLRQPSVPLLPWFHLMCNFSKGNNVMLIYFPFLFASLFLHWHWIVCLVCCCIRSREFFSKRFSALKELILVERNFIHSRLTSKLSIPTCIDVLGAFTDDTFLWPNLFDTSAFKFIEHVWKVLGISFDFLWLLMEMI